MQGLGTPEEGIGGGSQGDGREERQWAVALLGSAGVNVGT